MKWYELKEQSAGVKRLFITWKIYKIFGKNAVKIIAFFVTFFTFIKAKDMRKCSEKYLKIVGLKSGLVNQFKHFLEYSFSLVDRIEVFSGNYDYKKIIFDSGEEIFNKGVFIICSHLGNIDIMRAFLSKNPNRKVNVFLSKEQCKIFNEFMKKIEIETPVTTYPVEEIGLETSIEIKEKLNNGEIVFMAGDRTSKNSINSSVKFLNHKVQFPLGTFKFAKLMDCPVAFVCAIREKENYKVYVKEFLPENSNFVNQLQHEYVEFLEKYIKIAPLQFFHFYDMFENC